MLTPTAPSTEARKRLVWISLCIFGLFSLLIIQFYKIQIVEGERWTREALSQHQLVVVEPFKRGLFYSNTALKQGHPELPQPFCIDVPKFHLYADSSSIPAEYRDAIAKQVAKLLQLSDKEAVKLRAQLDKKTHSRKLQMWLSREQHDALQSWWSAYARERKIIRNALFFIQDYQRSYPFGKLLGQVLHTVREERDAQTNQSIPTGGLELIFNDILKGKEGKRLLQRSPRHPLDTDKILYEPEDGADVYLTINHYVQAIAEEEIAKAVKNANAKSGWAVMMEPRTGEIFALAQYPEFDPSDYRNYYNSPEKLESTKVKAVTDCFEPGSTFKPITMAICFKANEELKKRGKKPIFFPNEKIATSSGHFPGRSVPVKDSSHHRYLNMYMGIQKSSNIYMGRMIARVIEALGEAWYRQTLQELFGFGVKSGIELPSEAAGFLPTPGKKYASGALEWSVPTPYSMAFGYNVLVNSIQMVRCFGIIANGGYDVRPTLVRKIVKTHRDGSSEILLDNTRPERVKSFTRLLESESCEELVRAMKFATKPGGSAPKGNIFGYTEAGKTGTAEKIVKGVYSKTIHFSNFVGFAPAKNPRFILLIAIDEPEAKYIPGVGTNQFGGNCAAPAFREIATRTLQYLGVPPDDPYGYPVGDPRRNAEKADWAKECEQMKILYDQWNK